MTTENTEALLAAAELLLADVQRQREALGRREQELKESVAVYRSRLGSNGYARTSQFQAAESSPPVHNPADDGDGSDQYGAITESIIDVLKHATRKMNTPQIAGILETRKVPIRSKSYIASTRTAINRLIKTGKVRRVGVGYFRLV